MLRPMWAHNVLCGIGLLVNFCICYSPVIFGAKGGPRIVVHSFGCSTGMPFRRVCVEGDTEIAVHLSRCNLVPESLYNVTATS